MEFLKIAFFGTPRFAQIVLEKLIASPFKPELVITAPDAKTGRGQKTQPTPVKQTASQNSIKVLEPASLNEPTFNFQFSTFNFDIAILVAYGKIIPKEILQIPKFGFINVHPSLLPKYRGPSPIQTAILKGEEKTGVTIMLLDEEVDHGPILAQEELKIEETDTNESLHEKLGILGANLLIKTLPSYLEGTLNPKSQDHTKASFTKHITKENGFVNIENPPDKQTLNRMLKAFYPWPGVHTKLKVNGKLLIVKLLPGTINEAPDTILVQLEGKKPMTLKELKNGYLPIYQKINPLFG